MDHTYWQKQTDSKPLFPDIEWSRPQQKSLSGRLAIVGGNKLGFAAVAESYSQALTDGVSEVRVLLPDALKKTIPKSIGDAIFAPSTTSGGLSKEASPELAAIGQWSTGLLMIGDAGRNSETAILYERFVADYTGQLTVTRDAFELVRQDAARLVDRPNTLLVLSFAQVQKLLQLIYYPKILTFNMQLLQLVETMHKFTVTYPIAIATFHKDNFIIAHNGQVITQDWTNPMSIWRGVTATRMSSYWLWNPSQPLESFVASIATNSNK